MIYQALTLASGLVIISAVLLLIKLFTSKVEVRSFFSKIPTIAFVAAIAVSTALLCGLAYCEYLIEIPDYTINENLEYSAGTTIPVEDLLELKNKNVYQGLKYATIHSVVWADTDTCENLSFDFHNLTIGNDAKPGDVIKVRFTVKGSKTATQINHSEVAYITVK